MGDKGSASFFDILKNYKILFKKSQLPSIRKAKYAALSSLREDYMKKFGSVISTAQLRKKIQNMKNDVKKKSDVRATGNKPIVLKDWERLLLDLLEEDSNPVFNKVPGAVDISFGLEKESTPDQEMRIKKEETKPETVKNLREAEKDKENIKAKRIKLADETDETRHLTLPELQRLVLLKQLKLLKMKIEERQKNIGNKSEKEILIEVSEQDDDDFFTETLDDVLSTDT